ncbi:conserved hypothetical protein, partial [Ricinus communis]
AQQDVAQTGLARTAGAADGHHLTGMQTGADAREQGLLAEGLADLAQLGDDSGVRAGCTHLGQRPACRIGAQQAARVGMPRLRQQRLCTALLDHRAVLQHRQLPTQGARQPDIMGDAQQAHALSLCGLQQGQHFAAAIHVQSLGRFVDDHQRRPGCMGGQEGDALGHAARDHEGILVGGGFQAQAGQGASGRGSGLAARTAQALVLLVRRALAHQLIGLGDLARHGHGRVQRQPGLLRQQGNASSPATLAAAAIGGVAVLTRLENGAGGAQAGRQIAHDGLGQQRLARTALAQQAQHAAGRDGKADAAHQWLLAVPDGEVLDAQGVQWQGSVHAASPCDDSSSRPSKPKNSTSTGEATSHGASR